MSNELAIKSLAENVNDRVRSVIMDAMPKEAIDKLISNEITRFFEHRSYGNQPTEFENAVRKALSERFTVAISETLDRTFGNAYQQAEPKLIEELMNQITPTMVQRFVAGLMTDSIQGLRGNLQSAMYQQFEVRR